MPPDILPDVLEDLALANGPDPVSQPAVAERARAAVPAKAPRPSTNAAEVTAAIRRAVETNQIDVFLQPVVTLPQRKVKFYEVLSRLRGTSDQLITASDFVAMAEQAGMMPPLDYLALFRCVQVLRRLTVRNKEVGAFCNISRATLRNITSFQQCLDFLEANRALAPLLVLEFKQSTFQNLGPVESEHLAALAQRGFRFSIDNITDLRIDPRELADRGVRFIKVPATLLLDPDATATSEIHAADLSDLLGRFGIELIAEQIETERTAVDLLDFDIHYGQGHLFSPPRPLRPETPAAVAPASGSPQAKPDTAPPRAGLAALARRAGSS
jgi:cyclic-di-GMP phosphodiesterase TipF (flagellum assembly factor)